MKYIEVQCTQTGCKNKIKRHPNAKDSRCNKCKSYFKDIILDFYRDNYKDNYINKNTLELVCSVDECNRLFRVKETNDHRSIHLCPYCKAKITKESWKDFYKEFPDAN